MRLISPLQKLTILFVFLFNEIGTAETILPEQLVGAVQSCLSAEPRKHVKFEWQQGNTEIGEHWLQTENEDGPDVLISRNSGDFIFPDDTRLHWDGQRILEVRVDGNLIFNAGVILQHTGAGGGLILATYNHKSGLEASSSIRGIIDFSKASRPCVDFSQSQGALSILYNPEKLDSSDNKYANPTDFTPFIMKSDLSWFKAYMLIHNERDCELMAAQKVGDYALSRYRVKSPIKFDGFAGAINRNRGDFQGPYYSWSLYLTIEHFLFERSSSSSSVWGQQFTDVAPPLYGSQLALFDAVESSIEAKIESVFSAASPESFACIRGADLKTSLHVAAEIGNLAAIEAIWQATHRKLGRNFIDRRDAHGQTALELAIAAGKVEAVQLLVELYQKNKWIVDFHLMAESAEQIQAQISSPYEQIARLLKDQDASPVDISPEWRAFPCRANADAYDDRSARKAHDRFFLRDTSSLERVQALYKKFDIEYGRIAETGFMATTGTRVPTLNIDGIPSRSRIMLMRFIFERKLNMLNDPKVPRIKYWRDGMREGQIVDRHPINFDFGGTVHTFESQPTREKPGFAYYKQIGAYDGPKDDAIKGKIGALSLLVAPQKIAQLLTISRVSGNAINAENLCSAGYTGDNADGDATYLNRFIILWDLEVASRLMRRDTAPSAFDLLPVGTGIARAQSCVAGQVMNYIPFLTNSGEPGAVHIFSGSADERSAAISKIGHALEDQLCETRKRQRAAEFEEKNRNWRTAATAERYHQELLGEYGGGYESSGERYSPVP